jgi:hypothetical protein
MMLSLVIPYYIQTPLTVGDPAGFWFVITVWQILGADSSSAVEKNPLKI